ncbi:MAG: hypothetical protein WCW14_01940 [Candidatus Paceibacterota bacterium]|jgi:hypothetical protein
MYLIPILYAIAGALLTIMYGAIMFSFTKKKTSHLVYVFSLTILFFALFAWFISLPVFFANGNMQIIFWGYTAAAATTFGTIYVGLIVQSYLSNTAFRNHFHLWKMLTVLVALIAIILNILYPKIPTIEHGVLIWHANIITALLIAGIYFIYSIYWIRFFVNFSRILTTREQKRNMIMLAINGFCGGLGSILVFGTGHWIMTLIGASLYVLGALLSLLVFVVIPIFKGSSQQIQSPF